MSILINFREEKQTDFSFISADKVKSALIKKEEIAIIDVRDEFQFAEGHPLFAANIPLAYIETEAFKRIPRLNVPVVIYGADESQALEAARKFAVLRYKKVYLLKEGLNGWKDAGGVIFRDVNSPSKAFGELVEHYRHTPMLSAGEVKKLVDKKQDIVILDSRRFDEYHTMNIPGSISVPGGELVLRARELAPDSGTTIIVNCAGRTRSIVGAQSLINAGIPNKVVALRNGTMGWTLEGLELEHGASRKYSSGVSDSNVSQSKQNSRKIAERAGVKRATWKEWKKWFRQQERTTYSLDIRTSDEYASGHIAGFKSAPGGQLVQETDHWCPVRGARIVLVDDDFGVRANMTGSWLAQMGWEVYVIDQALGTWAGDGGEMQKGDDPDALLKIPDEKRYKRPYEGAHNRTKAMQDYLEWEYGLVAQLEEDGTHGFFVLK